MDLMAGWPVFEREGVNALNSREGGEVLILSAVDPSAPLSRPVRTIERFSSVDRCPTVRTIGRKEIRCALRAGHEAEQDHF